MTAKYKLMVVNPFENYKRGDEIVDQEVVNKILDVNNSEFHGYEPHVRRVLLPISNSNVVADTTNLED